MDFKEGDQVSLVIGHQTVLGYTVLIEEEFEGLLFNSDIYTDVEEGMRVDGYVKKIREDDKIDVSLRPQGFRQVIESDVELVLKKLHEKDGVLLLTDKSSPDSIKFHLQMSKKAFKRAIGNLYREKKIEIQSDRIVLVK